MKLMIILVLLVNSFSLLAQVISSQKLNNKDNQFKVAYEQISTDVEEFGTRTYEEHRDYKINFTQKSSKISVAKVFANQLRLEGFAHQFAATRFTRSYGVQDYETTDWKGECCRTAEADATSLNIFRGTYTEFGGSLGYHYFLSQDLRFNFRFTRIDRRQKEDKLYTADFVGNQSTFGFSLSHKIGESLLGFGLKHDVVESSKQKDYRSLEWVDARNQDVKGVEKKSVLWGDTTRRTLYFFNHLNISKNFRVKTYYQLHSYGGYEYTLRRKNESSILSEDKQPAFETSSLSLSLNYITDNNYLFFIRAHREGATSSFGLVPSEFNGKDEKISFISTSLSAGMSLVF